MSETANYVELKFPKEKILDILRNKDKDGLWEMFYEAISDLMQSIAGC